MNFIPRQDYVDDAPTSESESPIRIDHANCPAGNDTKGRLYIWRTADNSVTAYCHHCGLKGYSGQNKQGVRNIHKLNRVRSMSVFDIVYLPRDMTTDLSEWPVEAKAWLYKGGLTNDEIIHYGFGYSPYAKRVVVPCYDDKGLLIGYQFRKIFKDNLPKYLTKTKKGYTLLYMSNISIPVKQCDTIVITEDVLSCIRVGRTHRAMALMGTTLNDYGILFLTKHYKNVIIFLDNDNSDVKHKQEKLKKDLELVMKKVTVIKHDKDPKECTTEELNRLLP